MGDGKRGGFYRNLAWAAADFIKYMKEAYNIDVPLRRISGAEARNRVPGFCAHGDSGIARTDPGRDFDWDRFFRYIEEELKGEVDELAGVNTDRLNAAVDRILGRDAQRYIGPNGEVSDSPQDGYYPARSADLHDILAIHNLVNSNTNKVLDAVRSIPGVDSKVIDELGKQLSDELKEATKNLTVTLKSE